MKKNLIFLMTVLVSFLVNAQITIGNGTISGNAPFSGAYSYSYSQSIYKQSAIGSAGNITGLGYTTSSSSATFRNTDKIQVWIGHTSKSVFAGTSDFLPVANMTKVFDGTATFSGGSTTISFTTPFNYNNTDNLVIAVNEIAPGYGSFSDKFYSTSGSALSTIQAYHSFGGSAIDPANIASSTTKTSYNYLANVKLLGLTATAAIPQCTNVTSPANGATNVKFLPKVDYGVSAGATKYFVSVGTTPGGTDITNHYDNDKYLDYFFSEGLDPETTYYVTINPSNSLGEATGCTSSSFTTGKAVANDNCSTAEAITTLPLNKSVDATYASNNAGSVSCGGQEIANDGVWYSFMGNGEKIELQVEATQYWDPMIVVKEGSCAASTCVLSVNDTGYQAKEVGSFESTKGVMYYINIGNRSLIDFSEGTFQFGVKSLGVTLGSNETANKNSITIAPNPVQDVLYMKGNMSDFDSYQVYNTNGQVLQQGTLKQKSSISVGKLASGIYLIKLNGSKDSKSIKFIKK